MQENQNNTVRTETTNSLNMDFSNSNQYQSTQTQQRQTPPPQRPPQRRRRNNKKLAMQRMLIVIGIILSIFLIIFSMGASWGKNRGTKLTVENISNQLKPLSTMAQTNYHYTNISKFENVDDFYGFDASKYSNLTISYEGIVTASIDTSKIKVEIKKNDIIINLPEPHITANNINEKSIAVYNANRGTFENIELTDFKGFEKTQQPIVQSNATTNGLLFDVSDKAKNSVKSLIELLAGPRIQKYKIHIN